MVSVRTAPVGAASILGDEWEKFFRDRVSFAGYLENVTGLSIAAGDSKFTTSNRFIMNRLKFQPEFNVDFAGHVDRQGRAGGYLSDGPGSQRRLLEGTRTVSYTRKAYRRPSHSAAGDGLYQQRSERPLHRDQRVA
jgi:hypothetical protein